MVALTLVLAHVAIYGGAREADEGDDGASLADIDGGSVAGDCFFCGEVVGRLHARGDGGAGDAIVGGAGGAGSGIFFTPLEIEDWN